MGHARTPQADADLEGIWWYYSNVFRYTAPKSASLKAADRLVDSIIDRFFLLVAEPHIGQRRDEDLRPGLRSWPVEEFVIIYRIEDADVVILRVLHAKYPKWSFASLVE